MSKRKTGRSSTPPVVAGTEFNNDASYLFLAGGREDWRSVLQDDFTAADRYDLRCLLGRFWNLDESDPLLWEARRREVERHDATLRQMGYEPHELHSNDEIRSMVTGKFSPSAEVGSSSRSPVATSAQSSGGEDQKQTA